jgi:hypothetical protein
MSIKSFVSFVFTCAAAAAFVAGTALAADPAVKCESGKLKEASKYSSCRLKADSKAVKKGEAADYSKCEAKFADKWAKAETKAGVGICPSEGDQVSMDARITTDVAEVATLLAGGTVTDCAGELATCNGELGICDAGLTSCSGDLGTCTGDLGTCTGDLGTCTGDLGTCTGDLATSQANEATCSAGTAGVGEVLSGQTFSSGAGLGVTGTMANVGQQNVTPGTSGVSISPGFHDGTGSVTGDADLVALNIASGVDIFGVVGSFVSDCGNGVIDAGEDCDQGSLGVATCTSQGQYGEGLSCGAGCVFDTSGCSATRYEDTGLGTVIDHQTGLEWQKTDDAGGLTDKDNTYTWTADVPDGTAPNGTVFVSFLYTMNGGEVPQTYSGVCPACVPDLPAPTGCYAGHCDWRIPHIGELTTIGDCAFGNPCIDQSVFGATNALSYYWSSSPFLTFAPAIAPEFAWLLAAEEIGLEFLFVIRSKTEPFQVRAVRGGS